MQLRLQLLVISAMIAACGEPTPLYPSSAPSDIHEACSVAERRCSECHDRDRILTAHKTREEWASTVERMRQMPGSTIRPEETDVIMKCLLYRNETSARLLRPTRVSLLVDASPQQR
ncbi:MAG TPA: hypothetical protein VGM90_25565 [Kofleriaceae bacterium]